MNTTENTQPTLSDLQWQLQAARYEIEDAEIANASFATEASRNRVQAAHARYATCKREYDAKQVEVDEHNRTHDIATFVWTFRGKLHKQPTALGFRASADPSFRELMIRQAIAEHLVREGDASATADDVDFYEFTF